MRGWYLLDVEQAGHGMLDSYSLSVVSSKAEKAKQLRRILARYRGGRFEASGSGGAGGMVFFIDASGRNFYMGGFKPGDSEDLCRALNLVLQLLDGG